MFGVPRTCLCFTMIGVLAVVMIVVRSCGYNFQRRPTRRREHIGTAAGILSFAAVLAFFFWNIPVALMVAALAFLGLYSPDLTAARNLRFFAFGLLLLLFASLPIAGYFMSWGVLRSRGTLSPTEGVSIEVLRASPLKFVNRKVSIDLRHRGDHYDIQVPPYDSSRIRLDMEPLAVFSIQIPIRGKDAGVYGRMVFSCAILGVVAGVSSMLKRLAKGPHWVALAAALLGIATLSVMRTKPGVESAWGSFSDAINNPEMTLGYPIGPGLSFVGFLMAAITALIGMHLSKERNVHDAG